MAKPSITAKPRTAMRLSDLVIRQTKPDPSGKAVILPDGYGLRLVITPNGRKHFQFKTATGGKERTIQMGAYPGMSLDQARIEAAKLRELAKQGHNPVAENRAQRLRNRIRAETTFEAVANELLTGKKKNVSFNYWKKIDGALRANLYPVIGSLAIQGIDPPMLREALRKIEKRGSLDMLANVRRWASEVFVFAKANGWYVGDNPADALLKNIFQKHTSERMRSVAWGDIGDFVERLDTMKAEGATVAAVRLLLLTACRPTEVREAKWAEFDIDRARWEIPAARMKMRQMHAVPLSRQALGVLAELKRLTGHSEYLFPSRVGSTAPCLSDVALLKAVKRAADRSDAHAHGLRSTFSTHVAESLKWPDAVKEAALAHGKPGIEGLYDRATHYAERVKLMQWYADEIDSAVKGAEIIPLHSKSAA
jgi:integrase